jgi:hypothetical protein
LECDGSVANVQEHLGSVVRSMGHGVAAVERLFVEVSEPVKAVGRSGTDEVDHPRRILAVV